MKSRNGTLADERWSAESWHEVVLLRSRSARRAWDVTTVALSILLACVAALPQAAHCRLLSSDDILQMERITGAYINPDGRSVIIEYQPPYESLADFSLNGFGTGRTTSRLYRYNFGSTTSPIELPGLRTSVYYWFGGFSPTGRFAVVYSFDSESKQIGLSVFDFQRDELIDIESSLSPFFSEWMTNVFPEWVSDYRFVLSTVPIGEYSFEFGQRLRTSKFLIDKWRTAWLGIEPTATVRATGRRMDDKYPSPQLGGELLVVDARNGGFESISEGRYVDLLVSDNQRLFGALRQVPRLVSTQLAGDPGVMPGRFVLDVFQIDDGGDIALKFSCSTCDVMIQSLSWSPDSKRLAYFARQNGEAYTSARYHILDTLSNKTTIVDHTGVNLLPKPGRELYREPEYLMWLGGSVAVFGQAASDPHQAEFKRQAFERGTEESRRRQGDWFLIQLDAGPRNLTAELGRTSGQIIYSGATYSVIASGGFLWEVTSTGNSTRISDVGHIVSLEQPGLRAFEGRLRRQKFALVRIKTADSPAIAIIDFPDRSVSIYDSVASDQEVLTATDGQSPIVVRGTGAWGSHILSVVGPQSEAHKIWETNQHLFDVDRPRWHFFEYQYENQSLSSCAILPPYLDSNKRYPVIVDVYPRQTETCSPNQTGKPVPYGPVVHSNEKLLLASSGYIVVQPNLAFDLLRGPSGPLENVTRLTEAALDSLIENGQVDSTRIALTGFSNGGITAFKLLTESDRFGAAIIGHGAVNPISHYGDFLGPMLEAYPEWKIYDGMGRVYENEFNAVGIGGTLWSEPDRYVANSPLLSLDQVETPIMLYGSDMDSGFPMGQLDEAFAALHRLSKEAVFVRYWGEGHGPRSPANIRDLWAKKLKFLEYFLGDKSEFDYQPELNP